jgi:hypothetical protein
LRQTTLHGHDLVGHLIVRALPVLLQGLIGNPMHGLSRPVVASKLPVEEPGPAIFCASPATYKLLELNVRFQRTPDVALS